MPYVDANAPRGSGGASPYRIALPYRIVSPYREPRFTPRHEIAGEAALRNVSLSNGEKISSNSETRNEGSAPPWDFFSRYLHCVRFVFLLSNKRLFNLP